MFITHTMAAVGMTVAAIGLAAPAGADNYVALAIYDPPGPDVEVVHDTGSSAAAAQQSAMAACSQKYADCQPVGVTDQCIAVVAGPGVSWVYDTGATKGDASSNAIAKASQRGWSETNQPIVHCADGS